MEAGPYAANSQLRLVTRWAALHKPQGAMFPLGVCCLQLGTLTAMYEQSSQNTIHTSKASFFFLAAEFRCCGGCPSGALTRLDVSAGVQCDCRRGSLDLLRWMVSPRSGCTWVMDSNR